MNEFESTIFISSSSLKLDNLPKNFKVLKGNGKICVHYCNGIPEQIYDYGTKLYENSLTKNSVKKSKRSTYIVDVYQVYPYKFKNSFQICNLPFNPIEIVSSTCGDYLFILYEEFIKVFYNSKVLCILRGKYKRIVYNLDSFIVQDFRSNIKIFKFKKNIIELIDETKSKNMDEILSFEMFFDQNSSLTGDHIFKTYYYTLHSNKNILYLMIEDEKKLKVEYPFGIVQILGDALLQKIYCLCNDNNIYITYLEKSYTTIQDKQDLRRDRDEEIKNYKLNINEVDAGAKINSIHLSFCEKYFYVVFENFIHIYDSRFENFIDKINVDGIEDFKVCLSGEMMHGLKDIDFNFVLK